MKSNLAIAKFYFSDDKIILVTKFAGFDTAKLF